MEYLWNLHHGLDVQATLAELPGNLRTEVLMQLQAEVVQNASLFAHCDAGFIKSIVVRLRPQVYLPGDTVVHEGDAGKQLFFIGKGKVKVMSGDGSVLYAILKARTGQLSHA